MFGVHIAPTFCEAYIYILLLLLQSFVQDVACMDAQQPWETVHNWCCHSYWFKQHTFYHKSIILIHGMVSTALETWRSYWKSFWSICLIEYYSIFEPTCAYCTVGSYASLSVRPSVCPPVCLSVTLLKIHNSESIIGRGLKLYHSIKPLKPL